MIRALRRFLVSRRLAQARRELRLMRLWRANADKTIDELDGEILRLESEDAMLRLGARSRFRAFSFWSAIR